MDTTAAAIATALAVPNPDALDDMQPHLAWAALHGIARVHARRWSTAADEYPAAAVVAQAFDALAGACEDEEVAALKNALGIDEPPAEDMDYRLSSI